MWIARDKDGTLNLWFNKPKRAVNFWHGQQKQDGWKETEEFIQNKHEIDGKQFSKLTWDDEPIEVDYLLSKEQIDGIVTEALRQTGIPQEKQVEIFAHLIIHNYFLDYE